MDGQGLNFEYICCNIVKFYEGGIDYGWLEKQPLSKVIRLHQNASKINDQIKKDLDTK